MHRIKKQLKETFIENIDAIFIDVALWMDAFELLLIDLRLVRA